MGSAWKRLACATAAATGALLAGCAAAPTLPAGLNLKQAVIVPLGAEPDVQLEEAGWKSRSTRTGGMVGAGVGFGLGGLACMGTGFLAPLCLGTLVPLGTVVGAVGGAAVGTASSHHAPGVQDKQALLQREWLALVGRAALAEAVQRQLSPPAPAQAAPAQAAPAAAGEAAPATWRLQVGYATLGTVGSGVDKPFVLQATARLAVWRANEPRATMERTYVAQSAQGLTSAQWSADDALALRRTLDELSATLSRQIAADLVTVPR
jgi:hypothetical protein